MGQKSERPAFQRACFRGIEEENRGWIAGACGNCTARELQGKIDTAGRLVLPEVASGVVGIDAGLGGKLAGLGKISFGAPIVF
jgi:hypothetical protein